MVRNKYLFLDIDGVMKPCRSYFVRDRIVDGGFDPLGVAAINRICEQTGASIVFNSTWNILDILDIAAAQGITAPTAGKTNYPIQMDRLTAIKEWLFEHPADDWVALDDCPMGDDRAILVSSDDGISCQNYRDACRLLGAPDGFMRQL